MTYANWALYIGANGIFNFQKNMTWFSALLNLIIVQFV